MKILIFGASGSGTTTLGKQLEKSTNFIHLDADDYYWKPTIPQFREKRPLVERNSNLKRDFEATQNVIVSGSLVSWGEYWESAFDLAVFIYLIPDIRIERLITREKERLGASLVNDVEIQKSSQAFIDWAKQYDNPNFSGRSLKIHSDWMKKLSCPIIRLDGENTLANKVQKVILEIETIITK